jgi:hypothetical protein
VPLHAAKIQSLQEKLEAVLKTLKAANATIMSELNEFQAEKERNIRQAFLSFARAQCHVHREAASFLRDAAVGHEAAVPFHAAT